MKTCLIYGNCQIVAMKSLLLQNSQFTSCYQFLELDPVFLLTPDDAPHLKELVSNVDVFIHQPVSEQYKGEALSTGYLRSLLKQEAKAISFPVSYFTGYNPEMFYLKDENGGVVSQPFAYHDRNILNLYSQGKTIQETLNIIRDEDFGELDYFHKNLEQTLLNLALREQEQGIDTKISGFIKDHFREYRLFHTFDHPSVVIVSFIIHSILSLLDIESNDDFSTFLKQPEMLDDYSFPIYPSLSKYLGLEFTHPPIYRFVEKFWDIEEMIEAFFAFYGQNEKLVEANIS
jgi:Polysaccharide biosynthesis enzyme WcbI